MEHCNMCAVVSSALPEAQVVFSVYNIHFLLCACCKCTLCADVDIFPHGPWTVVTFRHLFVKVNDTYVRFITFPPFAAFNYFSGKLAVCTYDRKPCIDFSRMVVGICSNGECVSLFDCFWLSTLVHTSLLVVGGAIPDSKYRSSTLVDFNYHVTDRHVLFNSGSRFLACVIMLRLELHTYP